MAAFVAPAAVAQSRLPECPSDTANSFWTNCQGTITFPDSSNYVGEFRDNKRHGHGAMTWTSGNKYVGKFRDNKRDGQGTFTWSNGNKYVGEFSNGTMSWQETMFAADGSIISSKIWAAASNDAFFNVGIMFSNGEGLSKDYVQAYRWFSLSAAQGNEEAATVRDKIAPLMTPAQIAEARRLVSSVSSPFCLFGICTPPKIRAKGRAEEAQRLLKLGEEKKRTEAVCGQFTDQMERNACYAYGLDLGRDAALKQRRRSQNPYGSDPERCKYLEQVYFDCAHRNGASQCKVEDDARWACASQ